MAQANLYGQDASGAWVPLRVGGTGALTGGGGSDGIPAGQPEVVAPWSYAALTGGITDTADVTLIAAAGAGKANYVTSLQVMNSSLTATEVVVKSGATVLWRVRVGASMIHPVGIEFLRPLIGANNTPLTAACITTGSATFINVQGYQDATIANLNAGITSAEELFDAAGEQIFDAASAAITLAA